ncbi:unnamed protein product [Nesidiocoris tenuis]|uniref:Uncharacterized protein n=1 Tax=Nesidiocoris tenuis TaxID=355587 RepID=A0A6H5HYR9_9HEMI|nr:unnamed protein product [Nesidiocoris tenuis]
MSPGSRLKNQRAVWWGREITLKLRPVGRQTDSRSRPFDRRGTLPSSLFGPDESQDAPNPRNQKNTTQKLGLIFKWMCCCHSV